MDEREEDVLRVINGYYRAKDAANYGESVVCEMQQVSGDNYRMVWTNEKVSST